MSHINELIEQLCPEGVPYVALEKLCMKTSNIKWKDAGAAEYSYIDLTSVDISLRRITDTTSISANNAPSRAQQIVQAGDVIFATTRPTQMRVCVIPQEYDGQVCSTGFCVLRPSQSITTNYLMHALGTADFCKYLEDNQTMGNYPAISNKKLLKYRIPVPPIEVQQEIVNVLDKFARLESELVADLEVELDARLRQYAFYRAILFDFADNHRVRWLKLGDIADVRTGSKPNYIFSEPGKFEYINAAVGISGYVDDWNTEGDTVTTPSRGQGGIGYVGYSAQRFWCGPLCYRIRAINNTVSNRYLFHALSNKQEDIKALIKEGGTPAVNRKDLIKLEIPVPSIEEQDRIVAILDNYCLLVGGISQSIPDEIKSRRKQFSYYRDSLLSFSEKTL